MTKQGSIKKNLIIIPLMVVFLGIAGISSISTYFTRQSLLQEMEYDGLSTSARFVDRIAENSRSLDVIDSMMDEKIITAGNITRLNQDNLTNEFLTNLARESDIDEISHYNSSGVVIHSNLSEYLGWKTPEDHASHDLLASSDPDLVEDFRQDDLSGDFLKFGYIKLDKGEFVQVGISANRIQALTDAFSVQTLLENIASDDSIIYAMLVDTNLVATANSQQDQIGLVFDDIRTRTAAIDGIPYANTFYSEIAGDTAYDVSYPVVIDDEHMGSLSILYSMDTVQAAIQKNLIVVIVTGIFAFLILGFVLFRSSNEIVQVVNRLKEQMGLIASGDFTHQVPDELTSKNDELGEISVAIASMQASVRDVVCDVIEAAQQLAASSQELTATSQQSATAADEVAKVIEDIAQGAADQAKETEQGVVSISDLGDLVLQNKDYTETLNTRTDNVNTLKDEGLAIIAELVSLTTLSLNYSC